MKVTVFCFSVLSGFIPTNSNAKMNGYIEGSNLPGFFSAKTSDTAFLKQGDTVKIQVTTPPASSQYAGTFVLTSGDERCSLPSVRPYKYEGYKWPESIDMGNLKLSLVEPNTLGIVTGTAPNICSNYQPGGGGYGYHTDWLFVGNGMTATYRVSQIYRAGSASINTSVKVISGRSEYSQEEIISKLNNLQQFFQPVSVVLTTNVKNWCSASVGTGHDILLNHGEISVDKVNNHQVSTPIYLTCEGDGAYFRLKWFEGQNADTKRTINIGSGLQTELSIEGGLKNGKVYVPKDSTTKVDVKSILKTSDMNVTPGAFSVSQVLVIDTM